MTAQVSTPEPSSPTLLSLDNFESMLLQQGIYSSLEWNPTLEQMQRFKQREVELAAINIRRLWKKGYKKLAPDDLLCSSATLAGAFSLLTEQGFTWCNE